jgi:hypothetical protein
LDLKRQARVTCKIEGFLSDGFYGRGLHLFLQIIGVYIYAGLIIEIERGISNKIEVNYDKDPFTEILWSMAAGYSEDIRWLLGSL